MPESTKTKKKTEDFRIDISDEGAFGNKIFAVWTGTRWIAYTAIGEAAPGRPMNMDNQIRSTILYYFGICVWKRPLADVDSISPEKLKIISDSEKEV